MSQGEQVRITIDESGKILVNGKPDVPKESLLVSENFRINLRPNEFIVKKDFHLGRGEFIFKKGEILEYRGNRTEGAIFVKYPSRDPFVQNVDFKPGFFEAKS